MEKKSLIIAMKNSISDVLEKMFFLPLELNEADNPVEIKDFLCSKLDFSGQLSGYFLLYMPEDLARMIAADFMGVDKKKISNESVPGTLKEILNMIVGNTFTLYNDKAVFNLGIPEIIDKNSVIEDIPTEEINILINTPDNQMLVKLVLAY